MEDRRPTDLTVAYHEAGHAVMAMAVGLIVQNVTCITSERAYGSATWAPPDPPAHSEKALKLAYVLAYASGYAAEYLHHRLAKGSATVLSPENEQTQGYGSIDDQVNAERHLMELGFETSCYKLCIVICQRHLEKPETWKMVEHIAQILVDFGEVNGQGVLLKMNQQVTKINQDELEKMILLLELLSVRQR